jgi:hypothetical protein
VSDNRDARKESSKLWFAMERVACVRLNW